MVEGLSNSTPDERHLDLRRPRNTRPRSFSQAVRITFNGHGTQIRAYGTEPWVWTPRPPSLTTRIDPPRSQSASASLTRADHLREGPSEVTSSHSVRVERRGGGFLGRTSFVCIHTRAMVAREPSPEVYRADRDARKTLIVFNTSSAGKGLNSFTSPRFTLTAKPLSSLARRT